MRILRVLVRLCVGLGLFTLAASYSGALVPLGDSLAVFRNWIAYGVIALGIVALPFRVWMSCAIAVVAGIAALLHIATYSTLHTPTPVLEPELVVYSKNLAARWGDLDAIVADIEAQGADVVLLQEIVPEVAEALPTLLPDHPHQHICRFSEWSAMAVVSRYPLSDGGCSDHRSLAYATVATPTGPVWVASVHQSWPFPYGQADRLPEILAAVPDASIRQVIAGDFNMVPWGHSVRAIAEAGGTQRIGPVLPTIEVRGVGLPIDHVLTDGYGTTTRAARMGSDHWGVVARITWDQR